jgi:hypothetical protein
MSFMIWFGIHGAGAEEFASASAALDGYDALERRGAKHLQIVNESGREFSRAELERAASVEGSRP